MPSRPPRRRFRLWRRRLHFGPRRPLHARLLAPVQRLGSLRGIRAGRDRWVVAAVVVVLAPAVAGVAVLLPRSSSSAKPVAVAPDAVTPLGTGMSEPTPPAPPPLIDPAQAEQLDKKPAATAPLRRLPQVDLNGLSVAGIPKPALRAYVTAARTADCRVRWWLLAGIGMVESGHARSGGSAAARWNGIAKPAIYGPKLDGSHGFAAIKDSDKGKLDHDETWDRAVGPMQFLPSTWERWGVDKRGRMLDPQDIRAAAMAAAGYLCASGRDLTEPEGMATAVYSYNHSFDYVRLVLSIAARYAGLNPDDLGVNRLPHDKKPAKKKAKAANSGARPTASPSRSPGTTSGSTNGSSQASPAPSPSPSPSPSQSSGGSGPVPLPTAPPTLSFGH